MREFVERPEARLGAPLHYAAFSHRDTGAPHCHVIIRDPRSDPTSRRQFDRLQDHVLSAAAWGYAMVRARQIAYARTHNRGHGITR